MEHRCLRISRQADFSRTDTQSTLTIEISDKGAAAMSDWSVVIDLTEILTTLLIGVMGTVVALVLRDIEKWWQQYCVVFFSVIAASNLFELFNFLFINTPPLEGVFNFPSTLLASTLTPMLALYILHCSSENIRRSLYWKLILILWGLQIALPIFGRLTGTYYTISESIEDIRFGFMFYVSLMVGIVALAVNLIALIRRRERLSKLQFFVILLYFILMWQEDSDLYWSEMNCQSAARLTFC